MSFIIRSSNGQRTVTTAGRSNQSCGIRDELIEALRGLTIKFELRVSDIFLDEGDKKPQTSNVSEEILAHIKDQIRAKGQDQTRDKEQEKERLERVKEQEHIKEQAQEQVRARTQSNIRPIIRPSTSRAEVEATTSEPKIAEQKKPDEPVRPTAKYSADELIEIKNKMASDSAKTTPPVVSQKVAKAQTVMTGRLKIGSIMKTGCIWVDENNTPFITYDNDRLTAVTAMISNIDVGSQSPVSSVDVGDIVLAQSKDDDSWYRAVVEGKGSAGVAVYLFDWGLKETVDLDRIRRLSVLELGLSKNPATAIKTTITNPPGPLVDKFLECEEVFDIKVNSYDDSSESYLITILGPST